MTTPSPALPPYARHIRHAGSRFRLWWLDKVLRLVIKRSFRFDAEIPVLRDKQAALDLKLTKIDPDMHAQAVDCNGTPAEWITVPGSVSYTHLPSPRD